MAKGEFGSTRILCVPELTNNFFVEVGASDFGIQAVLSQHSYKDNKIHPCEYLSSEKKYFIGDRELLAIKTVFEEWRHWLEGAEQPLMVRTDHKNLEHIKKKTLRY